MFNNKKIILGLIFSALGFIYIMLITGINNLGASPDSTSYIEISRNIFNGIGLEYYKSDVKNTQWPPLYPVTLSLYSKIFADDSIIASKFLSAGLLFAAIFIFNMIIIKFQAGYFTIIILNLLLLTSTAMSVFLMIWSESMFILLLLLACYFFINWIDKNNFWTLFLTAFASGLLILTRYAGLGIFAGIIFFLIFKKEPWRNKLRNIIFYSIITFGIAGIWNIYLSVNSINIYKREFIFHPVSIGHLSQLKSTLLYWISPSFTKYGVIFLFLIFMFMLFDLRRQKITFKLIYFNERSVFLFSILLSYFVFIIYSISFIDFHIYLENRILAPAFPVLLILLVPLFEKIQSVKSKRFLYYLPILFILFSYCYDFFLRSKKFYSEGEGYTSKLWLESETLNSLRKFKDTYIYSNGADAINFYYNKSEYVYYFPGLYRPGSLKENIEFDNHIDAWKNIVDSTNSVLVYFDNCEWRSYYPSEDYLKKKFENFQVEEYNDGFILYNKNKFPFIKKHY